MRSQNLRPPPLLKPHKPLQKRQASQKPLRLKQTPQAPLKRPKRLPQRSLKAKASSSLLKKI